MTFSFNRFFGGPPLWVMVKLAIVSLIVGILLSALNISPLDLIFWIEDFIIYLWNLGFGALEKVGSYLLIGGAVVIPIWIIMRFSRMRQ
jgi:hypothetical protein